MTDTFKKHSSVQDQSVNFTQKREDGGLLECRYVRREEDYYIIYLSSQTGCNQACRFCHLTATGQTMFTQATVPDYVSQAITVFDYADTQSPAKRVHFNFMARGEPLLNPVIKHGMIYLYEFLNAMSEERGLDGSLRISTIMPEEAQNFEFIHSWGRLPGIIPYYSLYSMKPQFRKRWLPKSMAPERALQKLADYQQATGGNKVVLHWAFIEGENDSVEDIEQIVNAVKKVGLHAKLNTVRYNPASEKQGREPSEEKIKHLHDLFVSEMDNAGLLEPGSRIVPRVGFDVKASCGMFVS